MDSASVQKVLTYDRAALLALVICDASRRTGYPIEDLAAEFNTKHRGGDCVAVRHRTPGTDLEVMKPARSFRLVAAASDYRSVLLLTPTDASPEKGNARYFLHNEAAKASSNSNVETFREISWKEAMAAFQAIGTMERLPQDAVFPSLEAALAFVRKARRQLRNKHS